MKEIIIDCQKKSFFKIDLEEIDLNKETLKFINTHPNGSVVSVFVKNKTTFSNI